jgi:hypothetical protein
MMLMLMPSPSGSSVTGKVACACGRMAYEVAVLSMSTAVRGERLPVVKSAHWVSATCTPHVSEDAVVVTTAVSCCCLSCHETYAAGDCQQLQQCC